MARRMERTVIGKTLGRYRIVAKLGAGGMGEVYRARDDSLGRDVALKILSQSAAADPERRRRFEREAKAVASLQHPNIVTIFSIEEADGIHFLTMEIVEGQTLGALIPADGLPLERFFELSIPLADAVHAAHEQGVIHRDLKPGNVMVDGSGRLRVLDFGLAKLADTASDSGERTVAAGERSTQEGQILGTVAYMSPEQAEGKPIDRRSDVFSLGVVLYEMATGKQPFEGDTPISTLSSILKETPPSVTSLKPLPRHLGRVVQRCMEKNPDKRFQTARDVCNELEGLKREVDSGEVEVAAVASGIGAPIPKKSSRGRAWLAGAAAVILAVAAWLVVSNRTPEEAPSLRTRPLTGSAGVEYAGSWSPDGSFFAYSHSASGPLDIFVRSTAGGDPIRLVESPADDFNPAWSPDNRWIAFASNRDGTIGIYLVPPLGGTIRKLVDTGLEGLGDESWIALGANPWSPEGKRLVYCHKVEGGRASLSTIDLDSGAEARLTMPAPGEIDGLGSWSFDGQEIAFTRWTKNSPSLRVVPAGGGEPRKVLVDADPELAASWAPDGKSLVFGSDREGGIRNLWAVKTSTGATRRLTSGSIDVGTAAVGRDGRILFSDFSHQTDLYIQNLVGSDVRRLTFHTQSNFGARISPGNDRVVYSSDRTGNTEIWMLELASARERQITEHAAADWAPDWSPDGTRIVFVSDRSGGPELWEVDANGGAARKVCEAKGVRAARWSPDGEGIGFLAMADEGLALWLVEPEEGQTRKLIDGALDFDWYRDSRCVVYTPSHAPSEIRAVNVESGQEALLLSEPHLEPALAPDGSALTYCAATSHYNMNLQLLRLEESENGLPRPTGPPEALTNGEGMWHVHNGGWSPDAQRVIYTRDTDTGDVYVLEGAF